MYKFLFVIFSIIFHTVIGYTQVIPEVAELQNMYPGFNEIIIKESQSYDFSISQNKLQILQDHYHESVITSHQGIHNNEESIYFSELVPLKSFQGYTSALVKGKPKKIEAQVVNESSDLGGSVFYSDLKFKKFLFTNLDVGAKKIYSYQSQFLDPFLLHKFVFASNVPVKESMLEIITDKDVEIGFKVFNNQKEDISFEQIRKKDKNIYRWSVHNYKPVKYEDNAPGILHIAPHIFIYVKNYKLKEQKVEVLGSLPKLYEYYKSFVSNLNLDNDEGLAQTSKDITANLSNEEEKIKAIYYWVKEHIKYVAFEYGYEGFTPRDASLVYKRKFGDCKDMSSIIVNMAKYADIKNVNLCWIGTRKLPYDYQDIATPGVDDHMIASYHSGDSIIFLDATDYYTPFGLPSGFIQGKEALIQQGDSFAIKRVPVVPPTINRHSEKIHINLEDNIMHGTSTFEVSGLGRGEILHYLGDKTKDKRHKSMASILEKGNNKFKLHQFSEENLKNRDLPYTINYQFTIENLVLKNQKNCYVPLILLKPFEKDVIEKSREAKYNFDMLSQYTYEVVLDIPTGMEVNHLPQNFLEENDLMYANIKYLITAEKVILAVDIQNKKLMLEPHEFEQWNETVKKLKTKFQETIVLHEK